LTQESVGSFLRSEREHKKMSLAEVSRLTRIPTASLAAIESDRFDELPGEVFIRGFLRAYATAVGVVPATVMARYTSNGRVPFVTPMPLSSAVQTSSGTGRQSKRFGVAIAFVLLLILFTLALSIVLKPRGRDVPPELSMSSVGGSVKGRV
jgi:cytoskeletal protein RodZ